MHFTKPDFFSSPHKNPTKLAINDMRFSLKFQSSAQNFRSQPKKLNLEPLKLHSKALLQSQLQLSARMNQNCADNLLCNKSSKIKLNQKYLDLIVPKQEPVFIKKQRKVCSEAKNKCNSLKKSVTSLKRVPTSKKKVEQIFNQIHQDKKNQKKVKEKVRLNLDKKIGHDDLPKIKYENQEITNFSKLPLKRSSSTSIQKSLQQYKPQQVNDQNEKIGQKSYLQINNVQFQPKISVNPHKKYQVKMNFKKSYSNKELSYKNIHSKPSNDKKQSIIDQFIKTNRLCFEPNNKKPHKVYKVNLVKKKQNSQQNLEQIGRWDWKQQSYQWNNEEQYDHNNLLINPSI